MTKKLIKLFLIICCLSSCSIGANTKQKLAYNQYREKGVAVETRDPKKSPVYGLLPGGSSFYNGDYDVAVFNILLWPVSIIWEVGNASDRSIFLNLEETEVKVLNQFKREAQDLESKKNFKEISDNEFSKEYIKIYSKYSNSNSELLRRYKNSNILFDYKDLSVTNDSSYSDESSDLIKIDSKISNVCEREFGTMKREVKAIDKETFMRKCKIDKRKKFIELGL